MKNKFENPKKYGTPPFSIAVIHGGPGAAGEMAPVARELAKGSGVLEPLQTATTLQGQVAELKFLLEKWADRPVTLIGFSWGAWLSFLTAVHFPELIKKLILVGSGPFEEKYVAEIMETRLSRLNESEKSELKNILKKLESTKIRNQQLLMERLGILTRKADSFKPIKIESEVVTLQADIFQQVWQEASQMRRSGELLSLGEKIVCPVVVIHGDYDPHPFAGVQQPLSRILKDFKFVLLENFGHKPWIEKQARDKFYQILKNEL